MGFKAVAPQIGLMVPEDPFNTGFDVGAVVNLGEFYPNIGFYPGLLYWYGGGDISLSNFQITADIHYKIREFEGFYTGIAPTLNFLSSKFEGGGSDSETRVGIGFFLGYEMPIQKNLAYAKVKFDLVKNLTTFKIDIGYFFDLK
jgi:hypothetical protein